MDDKRLAKIEANQAGLRSSFEALKETIERHLDDQAELHKKHFETRDEVLAMKNQRRGAWAALVALASVFGACGAMVVNFISGKG